MSAAPAMECAFLASSSMYMSWVVLVFSPPLDRGVDFGCSIPGPDACPGSDDGCLLETVVVEFGEHFVGDGCGGEGDSGFLEAELGCETPVAVRGFVDGDLERHAAPPKSRTPCESRLAMTSQYRSSSSTPIACRPRFLAAIKVEPDPANGSATTPSVQPTSASMSAVGFV